LLKTQLSEPRCQNLKKNSGSKEMRSLSWEKLGLVHTVKNDSGYFRSHTTRPIPIWIPNLGIIRIFFSSRNSDDVPLPTYLDVLDSDPTEVVAVNEQPLLELGVAGTFDDSGITPTCIVENGDDSLMYYVGWKRRRTSTVTIEPSIGACKINTLKPSLSRISEGPIIGQNPQIPLFAAAPFVMWESNRWIMWLCSGISWEQTDHGPEMIYSIIKSESRDCLVWTDFTEEQIARRHEEEVLSAPWVFTLNGRYHMLFSTRGIRNMYEKNFRIGYASSNDGLRWERNDHLSNLATSNEGWDSQMVCYPATIRIREKIYCFYSGNGVGRDGFGVAILINAENNI
jgi:hypothetical protein